MTSMTTRHRLVTPPSVEPVSLAEAKTHVRVDHDASDDELGRMIVSAREACEQWTGRRFIEQTWETTFDYGFYPETELLLPRRPVLAVSQVATYDTAGVETVWGASNYALDGDVLRITNAAGGWPQGSRETAPLAVRWTAGYGPAADDVPDGIRDGILEVIRATFEREPKRLTAAARDHLAPFKIYGHGRS